MQNKIPSGEPKRQQEKKRCNETVMLLVTNKQFKFIVKMIQRLHRISNICIYRISKNVYTMRFDVLIETIFHIMALFHSHFLLKSVVFSCSSSIRVCTRSHLYILLAIRFFLVLFSLFVFVRSKFKHRSENFWMVKNKQKAITIKYKFFKMK